MYRCYLLRENRIGLRDEADSETYDEAIARCEILLSSQPEGNNFHGFEIWHGTSLIYTDATGLDLSAGA
jgi:hypothetical protein